MGCSSGVIGLGLVKDMLQARPGSVALFVPSEITSYCYYPGSQKVGVRACCGVVGVSRGWGAWSALPPPPPLSARPRFCAHNNKHARPTKLTRARAHPKTKTNP